jgi:signal transduction histidine kinase/ActR/RegA family two-component response regulator
VALIEIGSSNHLYLNLWAISQFALSGMWFWLYWCYAKDPSPLYKYWRLWVELPAAIWAGTNWGLVWVLFIDPGNLHTAFFLNTMICGISIGMVVSTPISERVVLASLVPCLIPIMIKSLMIGGALFNWTAAVAFTFLIACYFFFRNIQELYYGVMEEQEKSRQLAIALDHEKKQIEKISQSKTRFLASASHDLRQPIQAMYFFQSALANLVTDHEQKRLLSKINEANTDLSKMLEPLLDISKLDSGVLESNPELFWVDDLLHRAERNYQERAGSIGIKLRVMPAGEQQLYADAHHLERILNNLIENAIKHMGHAGKILVGVRPNGKYLKIEVHDNGKGISNIEQDKVFDEFYQTDNSERNSAKGLGLGLPIVRRLAVLNGGSISLSSTEGKGSCFRLTMPIYQYNDLQDSKPMESDITDCEQAVSWVLESEATLFVLEDEPKVAAAQAAMFEGWGFTVRVAHNIDAVLHHLKTSTPDMIISDYQLSNEQTGLEAIELIRNKVSQSIPAAILTGNTRPDIVKTLSEQSIPVLYKPVQALALKALIVKTLNKRAPLRRDCF